VHSGTFFVERDLLVVGDLGRRGNVPAGSSMGRPRVCRHGAVDEEVKKKKLEALRYAKWPGHAGVHCVFSYTLFWTVTTTGTFILVFVRRLLLTIKLLILYKCLLLYCFCLEIIIYKGVDLITLFSVFFLGII